MPIVFLPVSFSAILHDSWKIRYEAVEGNYHINLNLAKVRCGGEGQLRIVYFTMFFECLPSRFYDVPYRGGDGYHPPYIFALDCE